MPETALDTKQTEYHIDKNWCHAKQGDKGNRILLPYIILRMHLLYKTRDWREHRIDWTNPRIGITVRCTKKDDIGYDDDDDGGVYDDYILLLRITTAQPQIDIISF